MSVGSPDEYVCPRCGSAAAGASVCASCGADLDSFGALPLRSEFQAGGVQAVAATHEAEVAAYRSSAGGVFRRWVGLLIDNVLGFVLAAVAASIAGSSGASGDEQNAVLGLGVLIWLCLYPPVMLAWRGQTIGKMLVGVRVQTKTGEPIRLPRAFAREALVKVPILLVPFGMLVNGLVGGLDDDEKKTIHDLVAGTRVVKK